MSEPGEKLLDYYVGIMRGYLLAKDAPQQVLHALDILLTNYRSRAGNLIGETVITTSIKPQLTELETVAAIKPAPLAIPEEVEPTASFKRWKPEDDDIIIQMRKTGASAPDISLKLNRSTQAVYARIMKLKYDGIKV